MSKKGYASIDITKMILFISKASLIIYSLDKIFRTYTLTKPPKNNDPESPKKTLLFDLKLKNKKAPNDIKMM